MRSESEITWLRSINHVGERTVITEWHAIVPGAGEATRFPGAACGVTLSGTFQMSHQTAVSHLDGGLHSTCSKLVDDWVSTIDPSPGLLSDPDDWPELAPPGGSSGHH